MRNWPLFQLSVTTPRLELRYPSLDELDELADRAAEGIHEPGVMPFLFPWSDARPHERARSTLQYHFGTWSEFRPDKWAVELVAVHEGRVVGVQGLMAADFLVTREVKSGSWLGRKYQRQGIGTEMRRAVLQLAFSGLGAEHAITEAFDDNRASLAVTRKLGYHDDGITRHNRQGKPVTTRRFRLPRADWTPADDIEIHNLKPCLPFFGL